MSFLAEKISKNLDNMWPPTTSDVVTDEDFYLQYSVNVRPIPQDDIEQVRSEADQAVLITFKDIILELEEFTSNQVKEFIDFRIEYKTEKENFRTTVAQLIAATKLASQLTENDRDDLVIQASQNLKKELTNMEKQIRGINLRAKLTDLGAVVGGVVSFPGGLGNALGVIFVGIGTSEAIGAHEIGGILEQSPYTYLYRVKQRFGRKRWFSRKNNRSK